YRPRPLLLSILIPRPAPPPLFPYTTLFRSESQPPIDFPEGGQQLGLHLGLAGQLGFDSICAPIHHLAHRDGFASRLLGIGLFEQADDEPRHFSSLRRLLRSRVRLPDSYSESASEGK